MKLRRRGRRLLETPDWSKEEIKEMRGTMKEEVRKWQRRKERLKARLAWSAKEYLCFIDRDSTFVLRPAASDFIMLKEKKTLKR
jgi:hypothetical protein